MVLSKLEPLISCILGGKQPGDQNQQQHQQRESIRLGQWSGGQTVWPTPPPRRRDTVLTIARITCKYRPVLILYNDISVRLDEIKLSMKGGRLCDNKWRVEGGSAGRWRVALMIYWQTHRQVCCDAAAVAVVVATTSKQSRMVLLLPLADKGGCYSRRHLASRTSIRREEGRLTR